MGIRSIVMGGTALAAFAASTALAQTGNAVDASTASGSGAAPETQRLNNQISDTDGVEQIVVTARKQQEALIDVPVTVSALSAKKIDALGLSDFKRLANFTPGIVIIGSTSTNGRVGAQILVRGMTPAIAANVSVFIDGVPVTAGIVEGVDDAARIEVLKGPQTAYFGRSTFAGAINFVTKTPDMQNFKGRVEGLLDNHALREARAQVEGPIVKDVLSFRLAGRYYEKHGTYKNAAGGRFGDEQTKLASLAVRFTPTDRFSANFYGYVQYDNDGPPINAKVGVGQLNCNAGANPGGPANYICGTAPTRPLIPLGANFDPSVLNPFITAVINSTQPNPAPANAYLTPLFKDQFNRNAGGYKRNVNHAHLSAEYDADIVTFNLLAGLNRSEAIQIADVDIEDTRGLPNPNRVAGTVVNPALAYPYNNQLARNEQFFDDYFLEGRATTDTSKRLRGMIGVSYAYSRTANLVSTLVNNGTVTTFGLGAVTRTKTPAVFGSLSFDFIPELTLSVEGRYQVDKVGAFRRSSFKSTKGQVLTAVQTGAPLQLTPTLIAADEYKKFTPRVILQYKPVPGTMLYASYAEGTNPGTFNTSILAFDAAVQARIRANGFSLTVEPETIKNYEAGVKTQFWDNRAQLTAAVYYAEWSDQIVPQVYFDVPTQNSIGANANVGLTHLKGFELEGLLRPIPELEVFGSLAYSGSNIKQYVCIACQAYAGPNVSVIGNSLPRGVRWSGSAGAQYTATLSEQLEAYGRVDYYYKGSIYPDETNLVKSKPQQQVAFRLGVQNRTFRVEGFVTNAFNNRGPNFIIRQQDGIRPGAPFFFPSGVPELRRIGLRASYNFGS